MDSSRDTAPLGSVLFNALDGEMIGLEGRFYQIKPDGVANYVPDSMTTPFAVVTIFDDYKTVASQGGMDYEGLQNYLDDLIPDKIIFYAVKIEGTFPYIKTRSVPKQQEPYPPSGQGSKGADHL